MKVVYSPKFLEYFHPGHPESPQRLQLIQQELKKDSVFEFSNPEPATESDLLLVHTQNHIDSVKHLTFVDPDTPHFPNIYELALLSAGAAIRTAQFALKEGYAFSLARPPGHHAGRDFLGGFCYFNNLAIAVSRLLQGPGIESDSTPPKPLKRIAIFDIDVHHGNGTQDIFLDHDQVLFCSLHQSPLYPRTGLQSTQNCHNFPLNPGATGSDYLSTLNQILTIIQGFQPQLVAVSLGFDTYHADPLANLKLTLDDYSQIGQQIAQFKCPTFFALEGGYSPDIGQCAWNFFKALLEHS